MREHPILVLLFVLVIAAVAAEPLRELGVEWLADLGGPALLGLVVILIVVAAYSFIGKGK